MLSVKVTHEFYLIIFKRLSACSNHYSLALLLQKHHVF